MIPFRMQCPGCHSKVVVKHGHLLGKSLPCPKCQQLIAIPSQSPISPGHEVDSKQSSTAGAKHTSNRPQEPSVRDLPSYDSTAITKDDYGDWEAVLANLPQNQLGMQASHLEWGTSTNEPDETIFFQPLEDSEPRAATKGNQWQSHELRKRRQILLIATIGLLSSLVAGVGFYGFLRLMRSNDQAAVGQPVPPVQSQKTQAAHDKTDLEIPTQQSVEVIPDPQPTQNVEFQPVPDNQNDNPSGVTQPERDGMANLDVPNIPDLKSAVEVDDDSASNSSLLEAIRKFEILSGNVGGLSTDTGFGLPRRPAELDIEMFQYPEVDEYHPEPKRLGDWGEASGLFISRMISPSMPLTKSMEVVGRLTKIGVTIDWQACRAAGIDENPTVVMKFEEKSVDGIARALLQENGLQLIMDQAGFPLVVPDSQEELSVEEAWNLEPVVGPASAKETAELLVMMLDIAPLCRAENGAIVWSAGTSRIEKARAFETLVRLAELAGHPKPNWPGTETFSQPLFSFDQWKSCRDILKKPCETERLMQEARGVTEILQSAATDLGVHIFIDWRNAWQHGLTPHEEGISIYRHRTLPMIANRYLIEYALELVPIASDRFLLTTAKARRTNLCIVPIQTKPDQDIELVKRTLSKLRPIGPDGSTRFQFRAVPGIKDLYLARICPPNVEQVVEEEFAFAFGW